MKTSNSLLPQMSTKLFLGMALLGATACEDDPLPPEIADHSYNPATRITTWYSPMADMGEGKIRTWVALDKEGKPTALGVIIKESALENLPHQGDHSAHNFVLPFPKQALATPFKSLSVDWNPHGHEPETIYGLPHFDFHFYMISEEERLAIPGLPPTEMDPEVPAAKFLPVDYMQGPGRVPAMGNHWVDMFSPELSGGLFSQTFMFGSYKEKVIFYEPMITLDYLQTTTTERVFEIKQPEAVQESGYYPTKYRITYSSHKKEYIVALTDLIFRESAGE